MTDYAALIKFKGSNFCKTYTREVILRPNYVPLKCRLSRFKNEFVFRLNLYKNTFSTHHFFNLVEITKLKEDI